MEQEDTVAYFHGAVDDTGNSNFETTAWLQLCLAGMTIYELESLEL